MDNWYFSQDPTDSRRFTTFADDGARLFGHQHIHQRHTPLSPAAIDTSRSRENLWFSAEPNRAPVPYDDLSDKLVRFSPPRDLYGREHGTIVTLGYGWPFVAMATDYEYVGPGAANVVRGLRFASASYIDDDYPRAIPTRIVWLGLIANLALYTPIVFAILTLDSRRRIVVWRRRRRGACAGCGYALGDLTVCPECGTSKGERRPTLDLIGGE